MSKNVFTFIIFIAAHIILTSVGPFVCDFRLTAHSNAEPFGTLMKHQAIFTNLASPDYYDIFPTING